MKPLLLITLILGYIIGEYDRPVNAETYKVPDVLKSAVLNGMHEMYQAGKADAGDDIGLVRLTVEDIEGMIR